MSDDGSKLIHFGPFCLDRINARLLRDGQAVALTPKAMDLLAHLAACPDRLVTKEELLSAVWPDVIVGDASVKVCIGELRKALGDDPRFPRYIETVHRRGYRFLGTVAAAAQPAGGLAKAAGDRGKRPEPALPGIVGRDNELEVLKGAHERALQGARQVVFVTGDAGSGKTTLVDAFCRLARGGDEDARIGIGHCFEQFGAGEAYMPVWEAITQLDRGLVTTPMPRQSQGQAGPAGARASPSSAMPPQPTEPRAAPDRILRELVESLERRAEQGPLILILEDLHWSDYSTLDLLSALARRKSPARLLLIGTYRPGDASAARHPLCGVVHELVTRLGHGQLALRPLEQSHVSDYLRARMPAEHVSDELVHGVFQRTRGHPLFLASLVDDLMERGQARLDQSADAGGEGIASALPIPGNVVAMIQEQLLRLGEEEQRVLESAAAAGVNFSAAALVGTAGGDLVRCEQLCADLAARHRFLQADGVAEWPDGTIASRYRFVHELYHNVVYARIPAARCASLHRALALRLEAAFGDRCDEVAPELAMHFERGRDWLPAVKYLRRCAARATDQYAHREAIDYLRRARAALKRLPAGDREAHELGILMSLAVHLQVTEGYAAPSVQEVHDRAYAICRDSTDVRAVFPVLWGIWLFKKVRSELVEARRLAEKLLAMAEQTRESALLTQAHQAMSVTSLCLGEPLETCRQLRRMQLIYNPAAHSLNTQHYGQDPGVACLAFGAVTLWITGEVDEALRVSARSLELARQVQQPSSLALALHFSNVLHQLIDDAPTVERQAREAAALAQWEGFSFWRAGAAVLSGWALAAGGDCPTGIAMIRQGISDWLATGSRTYHTYYLGLLTDALLRCGQVEDALATVEQAISLTVELHEGLFLAELHRLKATCHLRIGGPDAIANARSALGRSISVARHQCARSFEDRAAADLAKISGPEPEVPPKRTPTRPAPRAARERHARRTVPSPRRRA